MGYNIAIDGPAGAGKSTIAKELAQKLGFLYVDTGAMYRAIACYCLEQDIDTADEAAVSAACPGIVVTLGYEDGTQRVYLNGEDVSTAVRREEVGNAASVVSGYLAVRAHLLDLQRDLAVKNDVIMDGRDIGTCVLPDADLKIYLTASVHTRALRRYNELSEKGQESNLSEIEADIEARDYRDMNRDLAPLKAAADAVTVDSSDIGIEEVVNLIYGMIKK